jgi:hypothetical protein
MRKGEPVPEEITRNVLTQIGVGQAATDLQFGNDMIAAADAIFSIGSDEAGYADMSTGLLRGFGNYFAGYTRPLDAVNKLVGYIDNSDAARDLRQAEGAEVFTQATSRYVDNIFERMFGRLDEVTGEELRVATREGSLYDPNPMARIFGITVRPSRTATESVYSMANMAEFTANERSQIPEYDRLFNTTIAPLLEREMDQLYRNEDFRNGDGRVRRQMLKSRLSQVQSLVRGVLERGPREGGSDSPILSLRRRASRHGTKDQRSLALQAMRDRFNFDGTVRDMGVRELQFFMNYIDYLDRAYQ